MSGAVPSTEDFLQAVIDSSVDAIISADIQGIVRLFNPSAQRLSGYPAHEVVDRMSVRLLYPPGEADKVMELIAAGEGQERGRLQSHQTELVARDGERIPVLLNAALIVHEGIPLGTVGVFTDLRARLHIEARLAQTQQELALHERKSLLAELAGATAHELNQPLTAVLGYAELVERHVEPGSPGAEAAAAIVREAERMADIVRKIGRLTKYETKPYVGEAKIIDLDRAVDSDPGSGRR
jgi:PAS domain S-box-containing protein